MKCDFVFFFNSVFLGIGLAMDAFSVSLANGLNEPKMRCSKMCVIAGVFAFFQAVMPLIGWFLVKTLCIYFVQFQKFVPWIALVLLVFIGAKMITEGIQKKDEKENLVKLGIVVLSVQGIATSIDALSVGFTISDYDIIMAVVCVLIIAFVTFAICLGGLAIGKKFGTQLSGKATIFGGLILVFIGIEIFVKGMFF